MNNSTITKFGVSILATMVMSTTPSCTLEEYEPPMYEYSEDYVEPQIDYDSIARPSDPYFFDDRNTLGLYSSYDDKIEEARKNHELNVVIHFEMESNSTADQSSKLQAAIDYITNDGGGVLYIPAGEYYFCDIIIKSNVHIEVSENAILRPYIKTLTDSTKVTMFYFGSADNTYLNAENCSIRCENPEGYYKVMHDDIEMGGIIFAKASSVTNFLIADFEIHDCYKKQCGVFVSTVTAQDAGYYPDGTVGRATQGELRHLVHYDAHPGYGLVQVTGAQDIYFGDLYCTGGVTLRVEVGDDSEVAEEDSVYKNGVYDIRARNIRCENGYCALILGPHTTANGTFIGDGFWAKNCNRTISAGAGKDGYNASFATGTKVINIEGIFGTDVAFAKRQELDNYNPKYYDDLEWVKIPTYNGSGFREMHNGTKWLRGSSISTVTDSTEDSWHIDIENVYSSGFDDDFKWIVAANTNSFTVASSLGFTTKDDGSANDYYTLFPNSTEEGDE